ncbi:zinc metallopeptidase [Marinitoga litoralis]|jgi:Zn-dependent membrane protease YugP|uniref:zinc metallopeptidase n=1 Tax=Marinitoga litoralis TaxID=570855 RepID=UPI0019615E67|nr:zinc metallopeptidase [Marinitoga litoralis]MBM7559356.1 Zn-dependent membrane protease YugP [Marinitoga litoralis]
MFYPFWFDPTFIILIPGLILSLIAQASVQGTFSKYSKVISSTGETGAEFARRMLSSLGLYDVRVEAVSGFLTDHYDPRNKVLRLSAATYSSRSVAALGVVAHEVGHAMQHQENYLPLVLRNFSVPFAAIGSNLSWIIFIIGFLFYSQPLIQLGILLFSFAVLFTLITLPVEFNASSRAIKTLPLMGMPTSEVAHVKKVLGAAAMTYVASAAMAILQLLRMVMIAGMFGDRD